MMMSQSLEHDISAAIDREMAATPTGKPANGRFREPAPAAEESPKRAVDQLSMALAGLLRVEETLNEISDQVAGPFKPETTTDKVAPAAEGLPMFDRVRADARGLAELAIRMNARLEHIRNRL
jgi:hypothetical protein